VTPRVQVIQPVEADVEATHEVDVERRVFHVAVVRGDPRDLRGEGEEGGVG
jgi:hypothetical protein